MSGYLDRPLPPSRHRVELVEGVPEIRIPLSAGWKTVAIILAGAAVAYAILAHPPHGLWDAAEALGKLLTIALGVSVGALTLFSSERLRVVGGDLEVRMSTGPFARTWRYRGAKIRRLTGWDGPGRHCGLFFVRPNEGAVRFEYEGRIIHLAPHVETEEGAEIAAWLAARLPRDASQFE
jgi:hypothetical protein